MLRGALFFLLAGIAAAADYATDIEPILRTRCLGCHSSRQQMAGLRLDLQQGALKAIVPGKSAESKLIHRVEGANGLMVMPPSGPRLTGEEIAKLKAWIDAGAPWGEAKPSEPARHPHWAFQPVKLPAEPAVNKSDWVRNPIDAFILARLEKEGIAPSPQADKRVLLRRLSLDLTGLPPTREELRTFLADTRPDAYERAVDRLLASPHFGERWARPWLDRARYADSDGYEKDWERPWAWRYRQWVIDALNSDMPFERFTVEQIAGDLLPEAGLNARIATGFHRNTLTNREGGIDNKQFAFETAVDRTNTVAAAWLGLTVGCAQCHDHKYDPISQKDFYSLYAFFENMQEADIDAPRPGELAPYLKSRDEYRRKRADLLREFNVPALQPEWERQMLEAAAHPGARTDWDLAWDCLLKLTEGGWDGEAIMRKPPEKRTEAEADVLTNHFVRNYHFAVGQKRYKEVRFDELDKKLRELYDSYPQLSKAMAVTEGPRAKCHLRVRGDYRTLGPEVERATPSVLPPLEAKNPTRLDLARWLVSRDNPLPARVTVNWVWQELFGRGIVKSSEDFGTRGDPPSHPALLDYLAYRFMEDGGSFKSLIRNIVTSATYRQSSKARPEVDAKDPENALLARQSRLRLPAELVRDAALHAAGLLTLEVGGESIRPPQPAGVAALGYGAKDDKWKESKGPDRYRRGLYIHFQRATPYPLLMNFDAPKSVVAQCRRERSNTPLQALNLLNDPVFVEAATALAYRALMEGDPVTVMFEQALGRTPSASESQRFREAQAKFAAMYREDTSSAARLAPAELPGITKPEAAAWVNLASVLLNTDEFITRE